jgi:hypothetical protein
VRSWDQAVGVSLLLLQVQDSRCGGDLVTQAQRALLAADMLPELEKEAAAQAKAKELATKSATRQSGVAETKTRTERRASESTARAGAQAGVGQKSVQQAKKLTKAAASGDKKAPAFVRELSVPECRCPTRPPPSLKPA